MSNVKTFDWGITLDIPANKTSTIIVWPEDVAVFGSAPPGRMQAGHVIPPTDRSHAWYYQHPGRYANASDGLSTALRRIAARWEDYGLTAQQGEYLRDSCGPDPREELLARGIFPAMEVYCPPERVGSMPHWEAIQPRLEVGWHPLLPLIGAREDQRVCC